eukprot:2212994-Amphidinium_carterae.1
MADRKRQQQKMDEALRIADSCSACSFHMLMPANAIMRTVTRQEEQNNHGCRWRDGPPNSSLHSGSPRTSALHDPCNHGSRDCLFDRSVANGWRRPHVRYFCATPPCVCPEKRVLTTGLDVCQIGYGIDLAEDKYHPTAITHAVDFSASTIITPASSNMSG